MDFPKICTWAHFGPSAYLKQFSEYFPANNSISDDKGSRQRQQTLCSSSTAQHPRSNATLNIVSRLVYPQPGLINLRVQHHQDRWRWSEASRSRGAACLYELLLEKEPLFIYEDRAHTHNAIHHKTKTTQHNTQTTSTPTANPTTAQLAGGKRPRESSSPGVLCGQRAGTLTSFVARSRSCSLVLRL